MRARGVLIVSPQATKRARELEASGFHSFPSLLEQEQKDQTVETPNVLGIYLLGKVAKDMQKAGIDQIRRKTDEKAKLIYDFLDGHPNYQPAVQDPSLRSNTTIVVGVKNNKAKEVRERLARKKIIVDSGYKDKEGQIRIANFPSHSKRKVRKLVRNLRHYSSS